MLPTQILSVDASIIDDQPDHLVLAIRVPKATLDANLPLLAAIAERTAPHLSRADAGRVLAAASQQPPQKAKPARKGFVAAASASAALIALVALEPSIANNRPPMIYLDMVNETPKVAPDGELVMLYTVHRTRVCKTDIDRVIMRAGDPGEIVWRTRVAGLGVAVTKGPVQRRVRVDLPDGLAPGKYVYRSTLFSDCGDDVLHSLDSPDVHFEVAS
jgi:hypothetical protein